MCPRGNMSCYFIYESYTVQCFYVLFHCKGKFNHDLFHCYKIFCLSYFYKLCQQQKRQMLSVRRLGKSTSLILLIFLVSKKFHFLILQTDSYFIKYCALKKKSKLQDSFDTLGILDIWCRLYFYRQFGRSVVIWLVS